MSSGDLWRDVHERLLDAHEAVEGGGRSGPTRLDPVAQVLDGARGESARLVRSLAHLRRREARGSVARASLAESLWAIFALGVLADHLLSWAVPGAPGPGAPGAVVRPPADTELLELRSGFLAGVGFEPFGRLGHLSPAHHELVDVVADDTLTEVVVDEVLWPGFRMGELLVLRAGVRVRAPGDLLDVATATRSRMYFTNRRSTRPVHDLSHGWGSESRWRTAPMRTYEDEVGVHLHWDGTVDLALPEPTGRDGGAPHPDDPPVEVRRALLLHRSRVTGGLAAAEPEDGPYSDTLSVRASRWPLREDDLLTAAEVDGATA